MRIRPPLFLYFFLFTTILLVTACPSKKVKTKTLMDVEETFEITVPGGWKEQDGLNDRADLQAGARIANLFVIVLVESKEDLDNISLEGHSDLTRLALMDSLTNIDQSEPKHLMIDKKPALQYEIRGTMDHVKIVYLHTTVESPTRFYQILAWTIPSRWRKDQGTLKKVTNYFRELKP